MPEIRKIFQTNPNQSDTHVNTISAFLKRSIFEWEQDSRVFDLENRPSYNKVKKNPRPKKRSIWKKPANNVVKINFDASVTQDGSSSIGYIFRDSNGKCISWKGEKIGKTTILVAETIALRNAIIEAKRLNFSQVHLEGDNSTVIEAVQGSRSYPWEIERLICDIQMCLRSFDTWKISHEFREANRAADCIAKAFNSLTPTSSNFLCNLNSIIREDALV